MKTIIIALAIGLLTQQLTQAQGTIYLSNLDQPSIGNNPLGSDSWVASEISTGNNTSGYLLDSIQLGMTSASGNPNSFTVMLYSAVALTGINPGSSLGTLNGSSDPSTTGIYTYTPNSSLILSPGIYFIVVTAGTSVANGAYEWNLTDPNSYSPINGWRAGGVWKSSDGLAWLYNSGAPQFVITATAIPEPGVLSSLGLGGLCFLWHRRKAKAV